MSKLIAISSSESSMKVHENADVKCRKETRRVSSTSLVNKKEKSIHDLDTLRPKIATSRRSKSSLDKKSSLENTISRFNVDNLSSRQMYESLIRLRKNAAQPFTFLNNILDDNNSNDHIPVEKSKPTEIDLQLATLTRRVQLNKSLLERTNERVKEINFLVERNAMTASRELNYDQRELENVKVINRDLTNSHSALNIACPGINELKRTINATKEMLTYVKRICNNEIAIKDLPEELSQHMSPQ